MAEWVDKPEARTTMRSCARGVYWPGIVLWIVNLVILIIIYLYVFGW